MMAMTRPTKAEVQEVQQKLRDKGFNPGKIDGIFGLGTQAAVMAFQASEGLLVDGVVGPRTAAALDGKKPKPLENVIDEISPAIVSRMFPHTPLLNIKRNLPPVLSALEAAEMHDRPMVLMALATIRAETESFEPIAEGLSRYNTSPDPKGHPFDLYDFRKDLGNKAVGDGAKFRGRGYVQLTGRFNYDKYGKAVGLGNKLVSDPDLACDPEIAGRLLAAFLHDKERAIKEALVDGDIARARRLVNGGTHGLDRFAEAYEIGNRLLS